MNIANDKVSYAHISNTVIPQCLATYVTKFCNANFTLGLHTYMYVYVRMVVR